MKDKVELYNGIKYYISEDKEKYYIFDKNKNYLSSLSKLYFKNMDEVEKYLDDLNKKVIKEIMDNCINASKLYREGKIRK